MNTSNDPSYTFIRDIANTQSWFSGRLENFEANSIANANTDAFINKHGGNINKALKELETVSELCNELKPHRFSKRRGDNTQRVAEAMRKNLQSKLKVITQEENKARKYIEKIRHMSPEARVAEHKKNEELQAFYESSGMPFRLSEYMLKDYKNEVQWYPMTF